MHVQKERGEFTYWWAIKADFTWEGRFLMQVWSKSHSLTGTKTEWIRSIIQIEELTWQTQGPGKPGMCLETVKTMFEKVNGSHYPTPEGSFNILYWFAYSPHHHFSHIYSFDFFSIRGRKSKGWKKNRIEERRASVRIKNLRGLKGSSMEEKVEQT